MADKHGFTSVQAIRALAEVISRQITSKGKAYKP